ncbi:MAG: LysR family transcriptional regulator [Clostridia bacterium]|nr:LysR family transcriptional regulator [Clostridia bacterium]
MDVKQIRYFQEVSRTGSFTSAAKKLYISAPGLVKSIDRLEAELGVSLFVRTRTGVSLTQAGHVLARYAQHYIRQHEFMLSEIRKAASEQAARVEVCMTWGLLSFFPRDFLSKFVLSNPDVSLTTHNYALAELQEALLEYRETIGLYFGELDDPSLEILFHRESQLHALLSPEHPLSAKESLALDDLKTNKIVVINNDPGVTQSLLRRLKTAGCSPQIILDGAEWTQAMELVGDAGYISFCLPTGTPNGISLLTRPVRDMDLTVNFNMATLKGVALSDAERRFADYVVKLMNASRGKAYAK